MNLEIQPTYFCRRTFTDAFLLTYRSLRTLNSRVILLSDIRHHNTQSGVPATRASADISHT